MGFAITQEHLGPGRIHHCMRWLGVAERAFVIMCRYATEREVFGSALSRKANIQDWIAEARADIHAARLMTLHAAWKIDTAGQRAAREEISLIKFFGAKVLSSVVDKALQVHGAAGATDDLPLSMFYRQARLAPIYDGPDEVHKMVAVGARAGDCVHGRRARPHLLLVIAVVVVVFQFIGGRRSV